jgi:hypothetical protein
MRRNRNEKQKPQRRKNQRRAIDIGDLLIETPFSGNNGKLLVRNADSMAK